MLGEFFGMTAVSSALLELNSYQLYKLSSMLNNKMDSFRISKFRTELDYISSLLEDKVRLQYNSPLIRPFVRQVEKLRKGSSGPVLSSMQVFGSEDMSEEERLAEIERLEEEISKKVRELGIEKEVVNSFSPYNSVDRINLGDYELAILKKFATEYKSSLKMYRKICAVGNFKEVIVFNEKLHDVASRSPVYLLHKVTGMFNQPNVNQDELVRKCLEWVRVMRSHFAENSSTPLVMDTIRLSGGPEINFLKYICGIKGIDYRTTNIADLPPDITELVDKFGQVSQPFEEAISAIVSKDILNRSEIDTLVELYYGLFRLDYDMEFVCERLFPEGSGILVSKQELEGVYNRLNEIGFYLFSFNNTLLFMESIRKLSFSSETKTVIDPDAEKNGYSFRRVLEDIEFFCYSLQPAGSMVEEAI
jgi:hypothetical protein